MLPDLSCIEIPVIFRDRAGNVVGTADSFQVRIVVGNDGKTRAESVEVYAKRLSRREDAGAPFVECAWFLPMNLVWANEEHPYTGISPKIERVCNIAGVMDPGQAGEEPRPAPPHAPASFNYRTACTLRLHTVVPTSSYSNWVYPGSYRLDVIVAAANAKSQEASVYFEFDGQWFADKSQMFAEALKVSLG